MALWPFLFAAGAHEEDRALMAAIQKRDPQALGRLYDRYGKLVFSVIVRIVRDQATSEDLVQETFLRAWNRAGAFEAGRGSAGAWLTAIARHRALDYIRSTDARMARGTTDLTAAEQPRLFVDFEHSLASAERVRRIRDAFAKLDENERMVLELAYFEGLSQSEMAERTKKPLGTIKTWVRRGLETLRRELREAVPA